MAWSQPKLTPTTTQQGYGSAHQRMRKAYALRLAQGEGFPCTRCGRLVSAGMDWHLDHTDDRVGYLGLAHARCNTRAGGQKARKRDVRRTPYRPSRRTCEVCGSDYRASYQGQRTCGRACGAELKRRNAPPTVPPPPRLRAARPPCLICGAQVQHTQGAQCSPECTAEYHRRYVRDVYRTKAGLPIDPTRPSSRW